MTLSSTIRLAGSYLRTHFRRHVFIIIILAFSFGIIMTVTTVTAGMEYNLFLTAEHHYGGDVFIFGNDNPKIRLTRPDEILRVIDVQRITYRKAVLRTLSYSDGVLYFAGTAVRQKYVFGIDWNAEEDSFRHLLFADGAPPSGLSENDIIISSAIADQLHARRGDDLTLEVLTVNGQKNTGTFVVRGIIEDRSIFGYFKCYTDRRRLNELLGFNPDDCSWIGFYYTNHDPAYFTAKAYQVYNALKDRYPMVKPADTREEFAEVFSDPGTASIFRMPVFTLNAYISQVSDLLTALRIVSYFVFITMLIIALASMSVSYRLILHERSREIGTLRVMGLQSASTQVLLLAESLLVIVMAACLGMALSLLLNWVLSLFSYSWIPGFDMLLYKGRLTAVYPASIIMTNMVVLLLTVLPAAWVPAFRIARADLPKVLFKETL